ncbi:tRNA 2-selenouridine(34) synthase MnmH [Nanoarchaeota archaeon]
MITKISVEKALELDNKIFVDVRSPKEFEEDHLPKAISVPVLDNEERAIVGTLYKQVSREEAIKEGEKFYEARIPLISEAIKPHKGKTLVVYCWRGGMRSKIMATLFETLKFKVYQLEGGYKSYRKHVIERISSYKLKPKLIVLHGLTCSGKTQLLQLFSNSIDLEGLAQHRGSLYGGLGLKQNSQKMFENLLLLELDRLNKEKFVFVEGESRRIGNLIIPELFWKSMKKGMNVLITRSLDIRAKECVKEYFTPENIEKIKEITESLQKVISNKNKQKIIEFINNKNYEEAAKILLVEYYDKLYGFSLNKIEYDLEVSNDDLGEAEERLKDI